MALDAVCLQAAVREIAPQVEGLKIEKIQQPARDQVVLLLRGSRLLLPPECRFWSPPPPWNGRDRFPAPGRR